MPSAGTLGIPACWSSRRSFGAYYAYVMKNGAPRVTSAAKVPRCYALVLDKWRIDELYEATVIAGVEASRNGRALSTMVIGRRHRAAHVVSWLRSGRFLRASRPAVVLRYAAVMAVGLGFVGVSSGNPDEMTAITAA